MPTVGESFKAAGYSPNLPLLVVPGLCSSILRVQETTYEPWADKRIWLNLSAIGMGKVWDFNITLFGDSKKKPKQMATNGDKDGEEEEKEETTTAKETPATKPKEKTERVEKPKKKKREKEEPFSEKSIEEVKLRTNSEPKIKRTKVATGEEGKKKRREKPTDGKKKAGDDTTTTTTTKKPRRRNLEDSRGEEDEEDEEEQIQVADIDDNLKRRWIKHMVLQEDGISDPPGIKLRAMEGLYGCAYLEPSNKMTKALSYVFGPFFEMLKDIGYTDTNLRAAPYDWRLPPSILEQRDGYFTKMSQMVMEMRVQNGKKIVLLGHSLGTRVIQYFLRWAVEQPSLGRQWISDNIETFLAVGPIFLGAPKTLRAMVTGERMGLEAFLFPEEGLALNRRVGSIPWMFPVRLEDAGKEPLVPVTMERKGDNYFAPVTDRELMKAIYPPMYEIYQKRFEGDKLHGPHEMMIDPPPVDNLYAIYGINLETEAFCFVKKNSETGVFEIDPDGKLPGYRCRGGIGYETKDTSQRVLRGERKGGDGTVPYASLYYCSKWADQMNVRIDELEQCDHRDILKDKRFLRLVVKFICRNPPPPMLPESFPDLEYPVSASFGGRNYDCTIKIRRQGIKVVGKGHLVGQAIKTKCKYQTIIDVSIDETKPGIFRIDAPGAARIKKLKSKYRREIVEEIASRCRYADRLAALEDGEDEEVSRKKEERDAFGQTALHRAASENKLAETKEQIELGSDVNAVDSNGWTPLHCAARRGHLEVVLALLQTNDINVNMVNKEGLSALHYLVRLNISGADELLTLTTVNQIWTLMGTKGANINLPAGDGDTPLHSASLRGNEEAIRWLLSREVNLNATNTKGDTALHLAIRSKQYKAVWILLQANADKFILTPTGESPISLAYSISPQLFALMCGVTMADLKTTLPWPTGKDYEKLKHSDSARMALQIAVRNKRLDWAFFLVNEEYQDVIPVLNNNGLMPIHMAAKFGTWDILMLLLRANVVDVNELSTEKANFLHYFVQYQAGDEDVTEERLQEVWDTAFARKLNLEQKNKFGETALHIAAGNKRVEAIRWLIQKGATVDVTNNDGETPLFYAIRSCDAKSIKELVDSNANVYHNSIKTGSPLDLAYKTDRTLVEYLRPKVVRANARKSLMIKVQEEQLLSSSTDSDDSERPKIDETSKRRTIIFSRRSRLLPSNFSEEVDEESGEVKKTKISDFQKQQKRNLLAAAGGSGEKIARFINKSSEDLDNKSADPSVDPLAKSPPSYNNDLLTSPGRDGEGSFEGKKDTPRVPTTSILRGRGNRADKARGVKIDFQAIENENKKDSEWQSVMNAIKFANAELHLEEISATSDNKLVTVYMNGKGDIKKIESEEGATEDDRVQAFNFCASKQRRIAFSKHNKALEGVATDEVKDILNGTMYATSQ